MSHYKPYPAYKDSGVERLGPVPSDWSVVPLKWLAAIRNGKDHKEVENLDGEFPVIGSGGEFARASQCMFDGESVLLGRKGTIDRPLYINGPFWSVDTMFYTEIGPKTNARYLYYCALTIQFNRYSTNTALPSMTQEVLGQIPFAMPVLATQCMISEHLDRETAHIDGLVSRKTRFIELLREKRQALITHAVTKGLDPNAPMKDSGVKWLGDVPAHWDVTPLKYLAEIGNGSTPSRENPDYWNEGEYPWLNSSVVNQDVVTSAEEFVTRRALRECHLPRVVPPAVLVGITGQGRTRGMATTLVFEATINQHMAFIKPNTDKLVVDYLRGVFDVAYQYLRDDSDGGGSTKGALTCEQISCICVPVPDRAAQRAIASYVERRSGQIGAIIDKAECSIELLKERRSALITAAVTGQIDLREAA